MLETSMSALAGGAGGLMGQIGNVLSAPRRFAWDALGLPEDGSQLLAQTFGMDPESGWTKALGMGAEVALDPLTYAGFLLGGPMAKMGAQAVNAKRSAGLATEIEQVAAARRAAQEALVQRSAMEADTIARYEMQGNALNGMHDLPSIAKGKTKTYQMMAPGLVDDMANAGMAHTNDLGEVITLGDRTPVGVQMRQLESPVRGQKMGSVMDYASADNTPTVGGSRGSPIGAAAPQFGPYKKGWVEPLLPDELSALQARAKPMADKRNWRQWLERNRNNLANDWSDEMAIGANSSRPMPTMRQSLRDQFLPTTPYDGVDFAAALDAKAAHAAPMYLPIDAAAGDPLRTMETLASRRGALESARASTPRPFLEMPVDEAFGASQRAMTDILARKKDLERASLANALTATDYARVGGGSYLASLGLGSGRQ